MIDLHLGDILNNKNFNILMFAGAVGLGVAWSIKTDNVYFLLGFIVTSVYSLVNFISWVYRQVQDVSYQRKRKKILQEKNVKAQNDHRMMVKRIYDHLDEEEKNALVEIVTKCERDKQYDDAFLIKYEDHNYVSVINAVHLLSHSTAYRVKNGEECLVDIFEDSPRFLIIYVDKELIELTKLYIKNKKI